MMASPMEFRRMMYDLFWEGKEPEKKADQKKGSAARSSSSSPPPRSALAALEAEAESIKAMREAPQAED